MVFAYLDQLIMHARLLHKNVERPITAEVVRTAEQHAKTLRSRVLPIVALVEVTDDAALLDFGEAGTGESGDGELLESVRGRLGGIVLGVASDAAQQLHESVDSLDGDVVELVALAEEDVRVGVPWQLVDGADDALVRTHVAARGEGGL